MVETIPERSTGGADGAVFRLARLFCTGGANPPFINQLTGN